MSLVNGPVSTDNVPSTETALPIVAITRLERHDLLSRYLSLETGRLTTYTSWLVEAITFGKLLAAKETQRSSQDNAAKKCLPAARCVGCTTSWIWVHSEGILYWARGNGGNNAHIQLTFIPTTFMNPLPQHHK
jgi:hypothetical protein